jgi:hypothetical protein
VIGYSPRFGSSSDTEGSLESREWTHGLSGGLRGNRLCSRRKYQYIASYTSGPVRAQECVARPPGLQVFGVISKPQQAGPASQQMSDRSPAQCGPSQEHQKRHAACGSQWAQKQTPMFFLAWLCTGKADRLPSLLRKNATAHVSTSPLRSHEIVGCTSKNPA